MPYGVVASAVGGAVGVEVGAGRVARARVAQLVDVEPVQAWREAGDSPVHSYTVLKLREVYTSCYILCI